VTEYAKLEERLKAKTPVTWGLIGVLAAVHVGLAWLAARASPEATLAGALLDPPPAVLDRVGVGADALTAGERWRLLSGMLAHSGPVHLGFNAFALHSLGRVAERLLGRRALLGAFLFAGLGSMVAIAAVGRYALGDVPQPPTVGASGAIMGVAGALLTGVRASFVPAPLVRTLRRRLLFWAFLIFALGFAFNATAEALGAPFLVSNLGHGSGLAAGAALGLLIPPALGEPGRVRPAAFATVLAATLAVTGWLAIESARALAEGFRDGSRAWARKPVPLRRVEVLGGRASLEVPEPWQREDEPGATSFVGRGGPAVHVFEQPRPPLKPRDFADRLVDDLGRAVAAGGGHGFAAHIERVESSPERETIRVEVRYFQQDGIEVQRVRYLLFLRERLLAVEFFDFPPRADELARRVMPTLEIEGGPR